VYTYFISYFADAKHHNKVLANCTVEQERKLTTGDDLQELKHAIEKECEAKNVVILNAQLLNEEGET
jgi:hypothetical protein